MLHKKFMGSRCSSVPKVACFGGQAPSKAPEGSFDCNRCCTVQIKSMFEPKRKHQVDSSHRYLHISSQHYQVSASAATTSVTSTSCLLCRGPRRGQNYNKVPLGPLKSFKYKKNKVGTVSKYFVICENYRTEICGFEFPPQCASGLQVPAELSDAHSSCQEPDGSSTRNHSSIGTFVL